MNTDEIVRAKGERLIELVNNPYCMGPLSLLDGVKEFVPSVLSLIESLQAQLAKYDEVAAEYGIDGKTMLTLAKSQIKTAQDNVELQEQLAERDREIERLREAQRWVSVSERLPEDAFGCLLIVEDDDYWGEPRKVLLPYFAGYDGEQWNDGDGCRVRFEVTHWMELPTPPEEGE